MVWRYTSFSLQLPGMNNLPTQLVNLTEQHLLKEEIGYPTYDRLKLEVGIGHLGLGGFHRSHQAFFVHKLLKKQSDNWMIHAVGMMHDDEPLIDTMTRQDNLYSLTDRSGTFDTTEIIGSIKHTSLATRDSSQIIRDFSAEHVKIISLTVTEKGYYYTPERNLDFSHPNIKNDLLSNEHVNTPVGYLFAIAKKRLTTADGAFTVMSCDNIPGNGELTRKLLLQFADKKDVIVSKWIQDNVSFPNSMVDRITPAVTANTIKYVQESVGIEDECPVVSESFIQWVI